MSKQCRADSFYDKCMYKDCANKKSDGKCLYRFPLHTDERFHLWIHNTGKSSHIIQTVATVFLLYCYLL